LKVVSLFSVKGGVGKTAAAVNLAYYAAKRGHKTLLVDLDAQGSAEFYFRIRPSRKARQIPPGGLEIGSSSHP
jgi:chromosome partitioning protein